MTVFVVPCLRDNYAYLVPGESPDGVVLVDPSDAQPISAALRERGLRLTGILCTHGHADHIGGLEGLLEEFPQIPVFAHPKLLRALSLPLRVTDDGNRVRVDGLVVEAWFTPGHTHDSVCYRIGDDLFTGDTLFGAGCGRLFEGTAEQMHGSLRRLAELPKECRVYPGHEYALHNLSFAKRLQPSDPAILEREVRVVACHEERRPSVPSTIGEECQTNPFLRVQDPALRQALGFGAEATDELVFAALRRKKDGAMA